MQVMLTYTQPLTGLTYKTEVMNRESADKILAVINHLEKQGVIWLCDRNHKNELVPTIEGERNRKLIVKLLQASIPPEDYSVSIFALCSLTQLSWRVLSMKGRI
jgi:hypothetical protein